MDAAQSPDVVMVVPDACADRLEADRLLRQALAPAGAPAPGWSVSARLELTRSGVRGEATLFDESGAPVAHRSIVRDRRECAPVGRALGVWAALVLDAEVDRVRETPAAPPAAPVEITGTLWPAPMPPERPNPDAPLFTVHRDDRRAIEIGVSSFVMFTGTLGTIAGPTAFTTLEVGSGWFLRPILLGGRSFSTSAVGTLVDTHFDACRRLPGNYPVRKGMQADVCLGSDVGLYSPDGGQARFIGTFGPSLGIRGELGNAWVAELRALGGLLVAQPDAMARLELGLSWGAR